MNFNQLTIEYNLLLTLFFVCTENWYSPCISVSVNIRFLHKSFATSVPLRCHDAMPKTANRRKKKSRFPWNALNIILNDQQLFQICIYYDNMTERNLIMKYKLEKCFIFFSKKTDIQMLNTYTIRTFYYILSH